jgi:hypothetical protein
MKKTASARFSINSWDEKPHSEGKGYSPMVPVTSSPAGS